MHESSAEEVPLKIPKRRARDKLYIIAEILDIAKDGALRTQIMYQANLSFPRLHDYLRFLLKIDLLEKIEKEGKLIYKSTEKGMVFLQRYREISVLLDYRSHIHHHRSNIDMMRFKLGELKKAIDNLETNLFNTATCPKCQKDIFPDCKFCPYCGNKLKVERREKQQNEAIRN